MCIYVCNILVPVHQNLRLSMLIYGTCNPEGHGDSSYEGLYLTDGDIHSMAPEMAGVPVKIEHKVCFFFFIYDFFIFKVPVRRLTD